ncbi:MAG: hypothetical protein J6D21_04240 [Clostridia bacterium]|nr:hypothetical protein [Clostridia bacterium]
MNKTRALTLCAVMAALSIALMFLGSVLEVLDLCTVMLASFCTLFVFIRLGGSYAWTMYAVTGVLALLLLPSKGVALEYVLFGGYYPILRVLVARAGRVPAFLIKLLAFNGALTGLLLLFRFLFVAVETSLALDIATYLLANVAFVLYDYALGRVSFLMLYRIRPRFGRSK